MAQNINTVGLYIRSAQKSDESIQAQKTQLQAWCTERGITDFDEYVDNGYSGLNRPRPAFLRLYSDAKRGKLKTIVTADMSRLGRDWVETKRIIEDFIRRFGVRLVIVRDGLDSGDRNAQREF